MEYRFVPSLMPHRVSS